MSEFFRFPHTPHIAWLGEGSPRDDKVLSSAEAEALLDGAAVVEEKLDGANLGLSIGLDGSLRAQNRGAYLQPPFSGQFSRLAQWLSLHEDRLFDALNEHLILFGEWCAARHSMDYSRLPDWWLMFDVYDRREQCFWSTRRRDALAERLRMATVPCLLREQVTLDELKQLLIARDSGYRNGPMEGVVVRRENKDRLLARGKLVRVEFTQAMDVHWRNRVIEWNRVAHAAAESS